MKSITKIQLLWSHLRQWASRHRKFVIILLSLLVILITSAVTYIILNNRDSVAGAPAIETAENTETEPEPVKYYSPLTGLLVDSESDTKLAVTGIMIENSPDARPQSGLKDSGIVFEAIAEGGITRFLVLYQQEKPDLIGPVRSLRLYDVDWVAAFDASVAHVGGSAGALSEVRNGNYRDIDQFFNASSYWRSTDRYAPHNVYTNFTRLDALNKSLGYTTSKFTGFSRVDADPVETPNATTINITISSYLYNSVYKYNGKTNSYNRSQGGAAHLDREDGQISPSVVIAMMVNEQTVMEDGYREQITTTGSGKATIFQNGTAISATWHKKSKTSQITFTDANGDNIALVRGQTWIAAIPNDGGGVTWN